MRLSVTGAFLLAVCVLLTCPPIIVKKVLRLLTFVGKCGIFYLYTNSLYANILWTHAVNIGGGIGKYYGR